MASEEERNARLDTLGAAISEWATARRKQLNRQTSFSKRVLKGRTGSDRLAQATVESASGLTVDAINDFLTGEV